MNRCEGVLIPDGTRHCFVVERGLGKRNEFHAIKRGKLSPSVDHFLPKSMGGTDDPENLHIVHWYDQLVQGGLIQGPVLGTQTQANRSAEERSKHGRMANRFSQAARTTEQRQAAIQSWVWEMSRKGIEARKNMTPEAVLRRKNGQILGGHNRWHTGPDARPCNCKHLEEEK